METQQVLVRPEDESEHRPQFDIDRGMSLKGELRMMLTCTTETKTTTSPFLFLSVDLPPPPLFQDSVEKNIIPQVSLASVLAKYDGRTTQVSRFDSLNVSCFNIGYLGIPGSTTAIQMPASTAVSYTPLQAFHKERLRRRKESHHCELPAPRG